MKEEIIGKLFELTKAGNSEALFSKAREIREEYMRECDRQKTELLNQGEAESEPPNGLEGFQDSLDSRFEELMQSIVEREVSFKNSVAEISSSEIAAVESLDNQPPMATGFDEAIPLEKSSREIIGLDAIQEPENNRQPAPAEEFTVETIQSVSSANGQSKEHGNSGNGNKEDLINRLQDLTKVDISQELISKAEDLKNEYLLACERKNEELLQQYMSGGGNADDFEAKKDPLDSRFSELMHILSDREDKFKKLHAEEILSKMKSKEDVIAELEKLISGETNIGRAFHNFKELQNRWNEIGNVPNREYKNLQSVYHRHIHNFYYNMKLSKDLRELDFKRNFEHRQQLLTKIEALVPMENVRGIERMINLYRMEWSELGPTAPETVESLRTRYRELIGQVFQKIRDFYQANQKEEQENLQTKRDLLEKAKAIAEATIENPKQWLTQTEALEKLFDEWKKIGFGPKKENEKVWTEFRSALNKFYGKKREYFSDLKKTYKSHKEKKTALIEQAEKINSEAHESWDDSTKKVLQLQREWKTAGQVEQWEENRLWKRFREACNKFFEAKREHLASKDADQFKNLEKKEDLIKRIEEFQTTSNVEDDLKKLREFSLEWKNIEHVPFKEKEKIWEKYKKVLDAKYSSLKLGSSQMHLLKFRNNVELLSQSDESGNLMRKEQSAIKEKINRLQATINQYENNLGFFRNSKNMGTLLQEVEDNLNRAKEEMQVLKQKLKMFSELQH